MASKTKFGGVSVTGAFYDRLREAADARGVTMTSIVEASVADITGEPPRETRAPRKRVKS